MYKQIIICRKDLQMTPGKLASQVSHASMAFLTNQIRDNAKRLYNESPNPAYKYERNQETRLIDRIPIDYRRGDLSRWAEEYTKKGIPYFFTKPVNPENPYRRLELVENPSYSYKAELCFESGIFQEWINGVFTKVILKAKNKNHLLKAKTMAEEMGMVEGKDFFLIEDCCKTDLDPEYIDKDGVGRCLTCIGFAPMKSEVIDEIGKKYQLYI